MWLSRAATTPATTVLLSDSYRSKEPCATQTCATIPPSSMPSSLPSTRNSNSNSASWDQSTTANSSMICRRCSTPLPPTTPPILTIKTPLPANGTRICWPTKSITRWDSLRSTTATMSVRSSPTEKPHGPSSTASSSQPSALTPRQISSSSAMCPTTSVRVSSTETDGLLSRTGSAKTIWVTSN